MSIISRYIVSASIQASKNLLSEATYIRVKFETVSLIGRCVLCNNAGFWRVWIGGKGASDLGQRLTAHAAYDPQSPRLWERSIRHTQGMLHLPRYLDGFENSKILIR